MYGTRIRTGMGTGLDLSSFFFKDESQSIGFNVYLVIRFKKLVILLDTGRAFHMKMKPVRELSATAAFLCHESNGKTPRLARTLGERLNPC